MTTSAQTSRYGNLIGGGFRGTAETFESRNPARPDEVVGVFPLSGRAEVDAAVEAAAAALPAWRRLSPIVRGRHLAAAAQALRARAGEVADALTREQGKPLAESRGEVGKTLDYLEYYAGLAHEHGGRLLPSARDGVEIQVRPEPLGVAALITPWNVPLAIPARKLGPAFVAGCTCVVKPSVETPLAMHLLAEAFVETGLPEGVLNVVHGRGSTAGSALAAHPGVACISFTGSTEVGVELAQVAARRLARIQLELGGKNAAVVLDDADLDVAVAEIATAAFTTTGQQCTATSRVLVQRGVLEEFQRRLVESTRTLQLGPLVSERQLRTVEEYVEIGRSEGAEVLLAGDRPGNGSGGWYAPATIFGGVSPQMRIAREEIFGPVLAVIPVDGDDEALRLANDSEYGLSAAVYTTSLSRAHRFVEELEAGAVAVNLPSAGWEVNTPFGGVKASGGGWKEQGTEAIDFFIERKAVQIRA